MHVLKEQEFPKTLIIFSEKFTKQERKLAFSNKEYIQIDYVDVSNNFQIGVLVNEGKIINWQNYELNRPIDINEVEEC